jgi:sugar-specific transcriptional regulator TrmB
MSWRVAVEKLGSEFARANQFLKELEAFPELRSTPSAARVRWALAQAGALLEWLYEHRGDTPAEVLRRVDEADKAIRLAEKAIDRARELMCLVLTAREERKRFLEDLALRLARTKVDRLRATAP